jgi:hypothetical protein
MRFFVVLCVVAFETHGAPPSKKRVTFSKHPNVSSHKKSMTFYACSVLRSLTRPASKRDCAHFSFNTNQATP